LDRFEHALGQNLVGLTDADKTLLRQAAALLEPHRQALEKSLDPFFGEFPLLSAMLGVPGPGADAIPSGRDASSLIAAYRGYLASLMPVLWKTLQQDTDNALPTFAALFKAGCADLVSAVSNSSATDDQAQSGFVNHAEEILSSMPAGLMVVEGEPTHLHVRTMNSAMRDMLAVAPEENIAGKPLADFVALPNSAFLPEQLNRLAEMPQRLVMEHAAKAGISHIEFTITPVSLGGDRLILIMAQDITQRMRAGEELRRFRMALDSSIDAVYLIDREMMRFVDANETAVTTLGYSAAELLQLGPQDLKPDDGELDRIHRRFDEIIGSDTKVGMIRTVHQRRDGMRFPVEVYLRAFTSEGRQLLVAVARDITARLKAEAELRESEERFRAAFDQAAVGLAHITPDGRWLMANNKLCEIVGYDHAELLKLTYEELSHPDDLQDERDMRMKMLTREAGEQSWEKRYRHRNGYYIWVNLTATLVWDEEGQPKYYSIVVEDISRRKQVEVELLHLANHDALTGLPNRSLLLDRLAQAISYSNRLGGQVAVMLIDLDRFKNVNDSLGHNVGDKIIMEIARRLTPTLRDGDTIARFGGDEFAVLLADVSREETVAIVAQKVLAALSQPVLIDSHELYTSGSIGISIFPKDGHDSQTLLKNADTAMYRAKDAGRNNFQFYASEMNARALDRLKLEGRLRRALQQEEFLLHYQPQMDIATGRIIGMEALLRWQPPGQDMIYPSDFISIAEETGLIVPIGDWVLRTACEQYRKWETVCTVLGIKVAVNLSSRQFKQQNIVKMVSAVLEETGCRADCLELEITESVVMENPEEAAATLQQLSDMGVSLAIDDFGTGYSSLSYLKRFPIDALKIDRSFVRDITTDNDDAAIAKAVIALARSLKLKVIAEGVETVDQLDFLREQRCDHIQGYFLSQPVTAHQIHVLLNS
jgi:diguanylate cyclase (GGDEF)-like protein/PAS domain S-box-containing protein